VIRALISHSFYESVHLPSTLNLFCLFFPTLLYRNGDEDDGYDETLIPVDYYTSGQITDDLIYEVLAKQLRSGVVMTCLMDCCHSGTGT